MNGKRAATLIFSYVFIITLGACMNKIAYQMKVVGRPEYPAHEFRKPWFMQTIMFIGMVMSWPVFWLLECLSQPKMSLDEPLTGGAPEKKKTTPMKTWFIIFVPAMLDLVGSGLFFTGLLYIDNSTAMMLQSTIIIFSGTLSYFVLGKRYNRVQLAGMATVMLAICVIGQAASISVEESKTASQKELKMDPMAQLFGIFLTVVSRFINACQFIAEAKIMGDVDLHPFQIVGTEGIYGLLVTGAVLLPIMMWVPGGDVGGVWEDSIDSMYMLGNNGWLALVCFLYLLGLWGLNAIGMMVVKELGVVYRAVTSNMKSLFVWIIDLYLFYNVDPQAWGFHPGEPWRGTGSWVQIVGFCGLLIGAIVYAYGTSLKQVADVITQEASAPFSVASPIAIRLLAEQGAAGPPSPLDVLRAETAALTGGANLASPGRAAASPAWASSQWFGSPLGSGATTAFSLFESPSLQPRGPEINITGI